MATHQVNVIRTKFLQVSFNAFLIRYDISQQSCHPITLTGLNGASSRTNTLKKTFKAYVPQIQQLICVLLEMELKLSHINS